MGDPDNVGLVSQDFLLAEWNAFLEKAVMC